MSQRTRRGVLIGDGLVVYLSHVIQRACEEDKVVEERKRRLSDDEAVAAERDAVIYEACSCVKELVVLEVSVHFSFGFEPICKRLGLEFRELGMALGS